MKKSLQFIPSDSTHTSGLLSRLLPPIAPELAQKALERYAQPQSWILDPFGAAPQLTAAAARAGYKIVVAANNPILRFLLEMEADLPRQNEIRAALAKLAATYINQERTERYIQQLYESTCHECGQPTVAKAFLWDRDAGTPAAKLVDCVNCGAKGQQPADAVDIDNAQISENLYNLHRLSLVGRIISLDDEDRLHVEALMKSYAPRATVAIANLLNKADSLNLRGRDLRALRCLLLSACEAGANIWPADQPETTRPRFLNVPARYLEANLWEVLERTAAMWPDGQPSLPVATWPLPPDRVQPGSLVIFEGRLRDLVDTRPFLDYSAVLAPLPRPNQAFWSLCILWSGWLWGRDAIFAFRGIIRKRRYDWNWQASALTAGLSGLAPRLKPAVNIFSPVSELEPGMVTSALASAALAGLELDGLAIQTGTAQAQIVWHKPEAATQQPFGQLDETLVSEAMQQILRQRNEPSPYVVLHTAALLALMDKNRLPTGTPAEILQKLHNRLPAALSFREGFLRFRGSSNRPETGLRWHKDAQTATTPPLADKVEMHIVSQLAKRGNMTQAEIEDSLYTELPGLFTPDPDLIQAVIESYANLSEEKGAWELREEDTPARRRADLAAMRKMLVELGERFGMVVNANGAIRWDTPEGQLFAMFHPSASANILRQIASNTAPPARSVLVIPGGRAGLLRFKMERDPRLAQILTEWRFLKLRHLQQLIEESSLDAQTFFNQIELDPLQESDAQMRFI